MRDLAAMIAGLANDLFGYDGKVVHGPEPRGGLPGRQPQPPLPGHHQGPHRARLRPAGDARGGPPADAALVQRQPRRGGALMRVAVVGTGLRRPGDRRPAWPSRGTTSSASTSTEGKVAALERGEPPIHERGLDELLRRNLGVRLRATTDLAAAVARQRAHLHLRRHAVPGRTAASTCRSSSRPPRQIGEALAGQHQLPRRGGQEHRRARHHRPGRDPGPGARLGQARRARTSASGSTPSSSPRARRSTTSCAPTGSSSAATPGPWRRSASSTPASRGCRRRRPTPPRPR